MKAHPAAELFPLISGQQFDELVADIRDNGQRVPIVVHDGMILDGRNRWRACELLDIEPITAPWDRVGSPIAFVVSVNLLRRHLDESQRAMIAARLKPMFEEEARQRQGKRTDLASNIRANLPGSDSYQCPDCLESFSLQVWHCPDCAHHWDDSCEQCKNCYRHRPKTKPNRDQSDRRARDEAAALVNVSPRSVESAAKVIDKGTPELVAKVDAGEVAVSTAAQVAELPEEEQREVIARGEKEILKAAKEIKERKARAQIEKKHALAAELNAQPLPEVTGRFNVIVIDPPWRYEKRPDDPSHRGRNPYPDMSMDQILALPVGERADDNCVLWLWATNSFMREAFDCLDAWGFTHKTILTWAKDRMGTGDWLRGKTEHCLLAVRGKPTVLLTNQTTLLDAPLREHSRKPDEFYSLVEALCPGTKLEMFSREPREGWQSWGAETQAFATGDAA